MPKAKKIVQEIVLDKDVITDIVSTQVFVDGEEKTKKEYFSGDKKIKEEIVNS